MLQRPATIALGLALVFAGACGGSDSSSDDASETTTAPKTEQAGEVVTVKDFAYAQSRIAVKAGTTVRWINEDAFRHTVTSGETTGAENVPDGRFDEDLPEKGSDATVTFDEPGTFTYYCKQHNAMDGTVVVS